MELEWYFTLIKDILIVLTIIILILGFLYLIYGGAEAPK